MKRISKSPQETNKIAKDFLKQVLKKKPNRAKVIALSGELGAGKTTFAQHFAKALGINRKVVSPTFVLIRRYPLKNQKHKQLYHLDAYRLKNEQELLKLGWREIISNREHIVLLEWPENVRKAIPKKTTYVKIKHQKSGEPNHRLFEIKNLF
jgi:tRNA threonylcarbamoyladenosine biosynthesis protein TsaE